MTDRLGQRLGNYRLMRLLGKGGFAEVYLGQHVYLKSEAAIKVLSTRLAGADLESFLAEARTLVALRHPHIVRLLEFGVEDDTPFLIMDYAPHGTLRQRYPKGSRLAPLTAITYIKQLASALQYAHDRKLIHRDIKPENFLLQSENEVMLSDFGIATTLQSSSYSEKRDFVGTVSYMAPEQIQGRARPASDQYALGVVAYEWLSGTPPFRGSFTEVCTQHILAAPPPLQQKAPDLPPEMAEVVMTALAKDPHQRFASVEAFARALEQAYAPASHSASFVAQASASAAKRDEKVVLPSSRPTPQPPYTFNPYDHNQTQPEANPPAPVTPAPQQSQPQRQRPPFGLIALISLLLVVLLGSGGGLFYYTTVYQPGLLRAGTATALARTQASATALAQARTSATVQANDRATATAQASATATTPSGLYMIATQGEPALNAPLNTQDFNSWDDFTYSDGGGGCAFKGGAYHVSMPQQGTVALCLAGKTNFSDFAYQVQMTITSGTTDDGGGLIFRSNNGAFYRFRVGTNGSYDLVDQKSGLLAGTSNAIKTGLNQPNLLTAIAQGQHISLYVNKQFIADIDNGDSTSGQIGLFAVDFTKPTDVAFSNAQVWKL